MKILILLISLFYFNSLNELFLVSYTLILIYLSVTSVSSFNYWSLTGSLQLDIFSYCLLLMLFYSMLLVMAATSTSKMKKMEILKILNLLTFVVALLFLTKSMIAFYIVFEISVIPIFLIVMGWGYQPERQSASLAMFFYTAFCSAPLVVTILFMTNKIGTFNWISLSLLSSFSSVNSIMVAVFLFLAFMVKLPMFGFHMWLPKAHVEAPMNGSMVLAAVLLKLAGLGILRLLPLSFNNWVSSVMMIAISSMLIISILCIYLFDMKMIIAYSSVAHMSLALFTAFQGSKMASLAALLMMTCHAFASSSLFFGITKIYEMSSSRSTIMNSGVSMMFPKFSLMWLLTVMASMATPPLFNFYSELICFFSIFNSCKLTAGLVVFTVFTSGVYSLLLYTASQHGSVKKFLSMKIFMLEIDYLIMLAHVLAFSLPILLLTSLIL